MAREVAVLSLALAVTSMLLCLASAQSTSGCTTVIVGLAPCLSYMTGNASTPSSSCCSQLSSVVQNEPQCLCVLLNGGATSLGLSLNQTRALDLPGACKVSTPSVSLCNAVSGPTASPSAPATPKAPSTTPSVPSGSSSTPEAPSTPSTPSSIPSSGGSKTTPSTTSETSDGVSYKSSSSLVISILVFVFVLSVSSIQL